MRRCYVRLIRFVGGVLLTCLGAVFSLLSVFTVEILLWLDLFLRHPFTGFCVTSYLVLLEYAAQVCFLLCFRGIGGTPGVRTLHGPH